MAHAGICCLGGDTRQQDGRHQHIPARPADVYDVTGAGDTAAAALAISRSLGWEPIACAQIANVASGIAVGKAGTAAVTGPELAMALAARDRSALHLTASGMGVFPNARRPRIIWVGLGGQLDQLKSLQQTLDAHLADEGFPAETRPFKGHLTLGRVKGKISADRLQAALAKLNAFESEIFEANRIILFKSELHPAGAVYTKVARVNLD